jgi:cytochrome P450
MIYASMISSDPPRHRKLRSLVTQAFTPRAVESLAPCIQEIVSPLQSMFPVTKKEVTTAGQDLPVQAPVIAWIGSANRDEQQFPHPEEV